MDKITELKKRKKELGYTNEMVAEKSGVPLGTVQKVFSGATANPRIDTMEALERVLKSPMPYEYKYGADSSADLVMESYAEYAPVSGTMDTQPEKVPAKRVDHWVAEASSKRWPRQGEYTIEDYFSAPDDVRIELIDGVIYDMATPTKRHQKILGELHYAFYTCIKEHDKPCEVFFAPLTVRLDRDDKTAVEPDLLVICDRDEDVREYGIDGAPDLVIEVLSPSTRLKDCTIKLRKYMNAGVKEYWIVDPKNEKVLVYLFDEDVLPTQYSFDDIIPVGISGGECSIDFGSFSLKNIKRP